jgi:hypothetical protein
MKRWSTTLFYLVFGDGSLRSRIRIGTLFPSGDRQAEEIPQTACLRARLIIPALKQQLLLSRGREGAVLFADFQRNSASTSKESRATSS